MDIDKIRKGKRKKGTRYGPARMKGDAGADLTRRELFKHGAVAGALVAAGGVSAVLLHDRDKRVRVTAGGGAALVRDFTLPGTAKGAPLVVATGPAAAEAMVRAAVDALGGMAKFIARGDVVVIKPNIGWDRNPKQAANTNPEVVTAVIKMAMEAGAKRVIVTDGSCNDPFRCFSRSGIGKAAQEIGAEVLLPAEHRFRKMDLKGAVLDEWPVLKPIVEADKVINVPVAKHHNLAGFTASMKNWYGLLGGRRNRLHQNIDMSIADLATFLRPTLVVVDAINVLVRNGPQGGSLKDVVAMNKVAASTDQVALDAWGCTLLGLTRDKLPYLKIGHERGIGDMNFESRLTEIKVTG
ncbi:MAG TPA: DUF362 domain-containing protein [Myxococcota bacterium]|jgi:uncharacterized protein (DUF362 family)|nr:DUF362 domain-containing protein [Myxococcota bacterium]